MPSFLEDGACQQRVIAIAGPTVVGWEMSLCTEQARVGRAAAGAFEPLRMQVVLQLQSDHADAIIQKFRLSESHSYVYATTLRTVATHEPVDLVF